MPTVNFVFCQNNNITSTGQWLKMSEFQENIKELILLSGLIRRQDFRAGFITHFVSRVKEFQSVTSGIGVKILEKLQSQLLEPLLFHLKTTKNSTNKCLLLEAVIEVLKITKVHGVPEFFQVYTTVFFQIFKDGNLPYQPSEELKECVFECCSFLIKNSTQKLLEEVYAVDFSAQISLGIFVAVNAVKEEKSIKLRLAALKFLLTASQFDRKSKHSKEFCTKLGDLFMLYLPGTLAPLLEVILREETQHHLITAEALCCFGHILCLTMKDSAQNKKLPESEIMKQWLTTQKQTSENVIDVNKGLKEKKRTKLWLESAAISLHPLIVKLSDVRKHSHPKCRLQLTLVMIELLKNCIRNLKICLPVVIETLVSSAVDEDEEVQKTAAKALQEFETECNEENYGLFVPVIEENLYLQINKLPRIVQSGNEQLLLPSLKSLSGYIKILGRLNRLQHLLGLSSTLKKLIFVIRMSFELETHSEISNQDLSIWDDEVESQPWCKPWKRFRYFADQSIKTQLEGICRDIGHFGQAATIFDFLLDNYHEKSCFKKEILLILNEVILGAKEIEDHLVDHLLDFYLEPENLCLPLQVAEDGCVNLKEARDNVIQVALIMEGIGNLARSIGKRFQDCLLKSLYYVLERMGSSYSVIREAATKSAVEIANACELGGSVKTLIQTNVDYLTYHLTVKLKRNDDSVFDVVTVLMKNSPFESVPNLEEIINSILKSSSQNFDSPFTHSYLRLFRTFVACVRKWMRTDAPPPQPKAQTKESDFDLLKKYLETATKLDEEDEGSEETLEEPVLEEPEEVIPEEPKKLELPRHLKLTLAVANHSLHYLASKDKDKRIIVLEILNDSVWALADWEDDLLPLVHKIWSPLVTKFELITDPLIINRSFTLLCSLSFTSKDFIRARTLKNVLPALESFLVKQATQSRLKDSASGYSFTQNFKLQRELLENLGKLAVSLKLFEQQTDLVVESALPYLSSCQPRELQEKCRTLFEDLKTYDGHLVWYKVENLSQYPEFAKNSEIVLRSIKENISS